MDVRSNVLATGGEAETGTLQSLGDNTFAQSAPARGFICVNLRPSAVGLFSSAALSGRLSAFNTLWHALVPVSVDDLSTGLTLKVYPL